VNKITCRCITCGAIRSFTDDDPIDEFGPSCEVCCGPMLPFKAEKMRKTERDARAKSTADEVHK
jgi:hypothetical protein